MKKSPVKQHTMSKIGPNSQLGITRPIIETKIPTTQIATTHVLRQPVYCVAELFLNYKAICAAKH